MSSVAEALLATGGKKLLLPPPPKIQKEQKTFKFELDLSESNDSTYPEFSWSELVRKEKQRELQRKAQTGNLTLNPYASDDEEDLKAMAAKFEAKYATAPPKKKKYVEDFVDKGAGYDETDPFIDNSDVYDEVVPADLQTQHGGFYINSGSLDFKAVDLSEDEEDSLSQKSKNNPPKLKKAKTKIGTGLLKPKNPVGRPPGVGNKRPSLTLDKSGLVKKRKLLVTPTSSSGKIVSKAKKMSALSAIFNRPGSGERSVEVTPVKHFMHPKPPKPKVVKLSSSSGSSSSSSSEGSSSSSDSESSSSEGTEENNKKAKPAAVKTAEATTLKVKAIVSSSSVINRPNPGVIRQADSGMASSTVQGSSTIPLKRIKTKNVPLNPKLHPNLNVTSSVIQHAPPSLSMNLTPPSQMQSKVLNKDLIKSNGGGSIVSGTVNSRNNQSPSGIFPSPLPTSTSSVVKPTPQKSVPAPPMSPGLSISSITTPVPKLANSIPNKKPKLKAKPPPTSNSISPQPLDLYNFATGYQMPNLSNFSASLSPNTSIMKSGMSSIIGLPKAMPNLKKMAQASASNEKLVQKTPKAAVQQQHQKPVKPKPKLPSQSPVTPPTSLPSPYSNSVVSSSNNFLSNISSYKTPPPLGGPGVDMISKSRNSLGVNSSANSNNTTPKSTSNANFSSPNNIGMATVSLAHSTANSSTNSPATLTANSLLSAAGISSILNASPNLANSVPSSLTVQRIPQSITITPTSQQSMYSVGGTPVSNANKSLNVDVKPHKQISPFDVQALLNPGPTSFAASAILAMKPGAGKSANSIPNSRDMQRK